MRSRPPSTPHSPPTTVAALTAFLLLWSSGSVATAIGLEDLDAWIFLFLRSAGTVLVAWGIWTWRRDAFPRGLTSWFRVVGAGLLMQCVYQSAFVLALRSGVAPGLLALVVATQPLLTAALTRERGVLVWTGVGVGLIGLTLACAPDIVGERSTPGGIMAACVALVALTFATLVQSRLVGVGHWANLALQSSVGLPVFCVIVGVLAPPVPALEARPLLALVWMVLAVGVFATSLLHHLVRTVDVVLVTSVQFLVPAVTALMDFLVRGRHLPAATLVGMGITLVALVLVHRGRAGAGAT